MALTGTLEKCAEKSENEVSLSIYGPNVKRPSAFQILFFLFGLLFLGVYGAQSIFGNKNENNKTDEIRIIKESTYKLVKPKQIDTLKVE